MYMEKQLVSNVRVYGLAESILSSGYPFLLKPVSEKDFNFQCSNIDIDCHHRNFDNKHIKRAIKLANVPVGSGHDNFLNGIIVQFDLKMTKAWSPEMQRYHFIDFVSSMSMVHCATKMDFLELAVDHADKEMIEKAKTYVERYKNGEIELEVLLDNIPPSINLSARMTTNYRQLRTMYYQRRNHPVKKWREFCKWIETLPMAKEFICNVQ